MTSVKEICLMMTVLQNSFSVISENKTLLEKHHRKNVTWKTLLEKMLSIILKG
jgi:hypothetical protein